MDKTITTSLLIIAGIVCSIFLFNSVYPMINRSSAAMVSMTDKLNDKMQSQIDIVEATGSTSSYTMNIWVKNVGTTQIDAIDQSDIFLGPEGNFARIPYTADAAGSYPQWSYTIENGTEWTTGVTVEITITYTTYPSSGTYYVKVVIPNGVSAEYYFSI